MVIENSSIIDSLYLTLITISTLGMRAAADADISQAGQLWIMLLIVVGIAAAMIALSLVVGIVVEGHVRNILGRHQLNSKIASLSDHSIVCGYGHMGQSVCQNLRLRDTTVVVIDQNPERTAQAETDGLLYVLGDATDESALRTAGIERAKCLVAVLATDADNVFATLVASDLNADLFIAARAERVESESRLLRAGADKVICPQVIGRCPASQYPHPARRGRLHRTSHPKGSSSKPKQYHVRPDCKLVGQTIRQANLPRQVGILIIALKRENGEIDFNPNPDTVLSPHDVIIITGQTGSMARLEKQFG